MRVDVFDSLVEGNTFPLGDRQWMVGGVQLYERPQSACPGVHVAPQVQGLGEAGRLLENQPNIGGSSTRSASFSASKVGR
jgi:hypothetical protein